MMCQFLRVLSICVLIISCRTTEKPQSINGHWHFYSPGNGPHDAVFQTLDISDTIVTTDRYDLGGEIINFPRRSETGGWLLPVNEYSLSSYKHNIWDDVLTIKEDSAEFHVYIKSDPKNCEIRDRYLSSTIDIDLKLEDSAFLYDELFFRSNINTKVATHAHNSCADIFVGTSARSFSLSFDTQYFEELTTDHPDSIFIQFVDHFFNLNEISRIVKFTIDSKNSNNIVIHADRNVPETFISKVLERVPTSVKVYKAIRTPAGPLGVIEIRGANHGEQRR